MLRIRNSFQVKLQLLNSHESSEHEVPFLGIKYHEIGDTHHIKSIWLAILDYDEKKVDTCHQIDVNEIELKSIRSIKFCKNILIDDTIKTKSDFEKMPNDCKKQ